MKDEILDDINNPDVINRIWEKGLIIDGYSPDLYRQDVAGAWMARESYGIRDSIMGWEIDHIFPLSKGGDNNFDNLRPMNWRNNLSKGENYPQYMAEITSEGGKNIYKNSACTVNQRLQQILNSLYHDK